MKKIVLIALGALMFTANADAQKQAGNEKNLQVLFAPLGGSPVSLNGGGISFRKFNSDGTSAWRLNLFIGLNNKTEVTGQPIDTGSYTTGGGKPELDKKTSGMTIGLRPGYEKHFAGTEKLSPYIGAEILFSMTTKTVKEDQLGNNGTNTSAATAWSVLTEERKGDGASTTFGVNLIAGMDYYIAKNLALGAEFGFGFSTTSMPDIEQTSAQNNSTTGAFELVTDPKQKQGSSMNVGPNVTGQLKLGWLF
ncbi:MAG: outer membrane beta-barrel protein [Bacteroidetes bacterium]|nr:outer membrane beta-barrel protein [Bacteroidota bacterium]